MDRIELADFDLDLDATTDLQAESGAEEQAISGSVGCICCPF